MHYARPTCIGGGNPSKKYPLWGYFFTSRKPLRGYMHDMHEKNTPYGAIFSEKIPPIGGKDENLGLFFLEIEIFLSTSNRQKYPKFSPFGLNLGQIEDNLGPNGLNYHKLSQIRPIFSQKEAN